MQLIAQTLLDKFNNVTQPVDDITLIHAVKKKVLVECFKLGVFKIQFTKIDGTNSEMLVTLKDGLIPSIDTSRQASTENNENILVFAVDRVGWRSFKVANLISMVPV